MAETLMNYEREMQDNDLKYGDLPKDAQVGIDEIKKVQKAIKMLEKSGKKPGTAALNKLNSLDKWVTYEIYDHLEGTDNNADTMPHTSEEIKDDLKDEPATPPQTTEPTQTNDDPDTQTGILIDNELNALHESGQTDFHIDSIKKSCPNTYDVIFSNYEPGKPNGVKTSNFELMEVTEENFKLKKM